MKIINRINNVIGAEENSRTTPRETHNIRGITLANLHRVDSCKIKFGNYALPHLKVLRNNDILQYTTIQLRPTETNEILMVIAYGKIGRKCRHPIRLTFPNLQSASAVANRKVEDKRKEGYVVETSISQGEILYNRS